MSTEAEEFKQGASGRLARFIAATRWDDVAQPVRHEAKRSLMNFFACALGGCRDAAIEASLAVLGRYSGERTATVIGRGDKSDALTAAFLNAAGANVFDFDDTHTRTIIHPVAPVAPALFALAEVVPMTGADLVLGLVLGVEAECRVGNAVSPGHYRRGWHITSTCGVFGAAAAAASALGLPAERVKWALGHASAQAGGLLETLGTMGKSVSVGNAARNGLVAALFAQAGVSGPERPLEGTYGFLRVTGESADVSCLTEGLGEHWEIALNTYKPYPCGIVLSPVIDACFALVAGHGLAAGEVVGVEITGHPLLRERTDRAHPASGRESQVSAQHAVAVVLTRGRAGLDEFSDACAADPTLRGLRERVRFVDDSASPVERATVRVHLRGGGTLERTIDRPRGSSANPLSDRELEMKLEELAAYGRARVDTRSLIDAIWNIDVARDAAAVVALARG